MAKFKGRDLRIKVRTSTYNPDVFLPLLVVRVLMVLLSIMKLSMLQTKTVQDGANYCRVLVLLA